MQYYLPFESYPWIPGDPLEAEKTHACSKRRNQLADEL